MRSMREVPSFPFPDSSTLEGLKAQIQDKSRRLEVLVEELGWGHSDLDPLLAEIEALVQEQSQLVEARTQEAT